MEWKEIKRVPISPSPEGQRTTIVSDKGELFLSYQEKVPTEQDITKECTVEFTQSRHSGGYYCNIMHDGKSVVALGVDDTSRSTIKSGYRMVKAPGATVSFRIVKVK